MKKAIWKGGHGRLPIVGDVTDEQEIEGPDEIIDSYIKQGKAVDVNVSKPKSKTSKTEETEQ